jgi:hypothetical protein
MKTSLLAAVVFIPCLAFAGAASTTAPAEAIRELAVITHNLNLTQSQQDRIRPILVAEWEKRQAIQDSTLSDKQKHDQTGTVHRAALKQIKAVFTPAQMAIIEQGQNHSPTSPTSRTSPTSPTAQN